MMSFRMKNMLKSMGIDQGGPKYPYWVMVFDQDDYVVATDDGVVVFYYETWDDAFEDATRMYEAATLGMTIRIGNPFKVFHRDILVTNEDIVDYEPADGDPF